MKKRILTLLLVVSMIMGSFTGCKGNTTEPNKQTVPTTQVTPTTQPEPTTQAEPTAAPDPTVQVTPTQAAATTPTKADYLAAITREPYTGTEISLTNANATETTKKVYNYLSDTYGSNIIAGQQESTWMGSSEYEMDIIFGASGKLPAIRGLDFMNDDFDGVASRAKAWWDQGGLVTICWHTGYDFNGSWNESMKTEIKDWDKSLTKGTTEYDALIAGMDKAVPALQKLQEEGVVVLWRPFHELDGAWFWWGKGGPENFKKLWKIMYDRYTNHWGLNNLIWVLGYSGNGKGYADWYPGDEYVDIAGADSYSEGAQGGLYKKVIDVVGDRKPVVFHECGTIPTVLQLKEDAAGWLWFMTWHTDFISKEENNTKASINAIYNDDYVITFDELPSFQ